LGIPTNPIVLDGGGEMNDHWVVIDQYQLRSIA
jgi:hypothetical protein